MATQTSREEVRRRESTVAHGSYPYGNVTGRRFSLEYQIAEATVDNATKEPCFYSSTEHSLLPHSTQTIPACSKETAYEVAFPVRSLVGSGRRRSGESAPPHFDAP